MFDEVLSSQTKLCRVKQGRERGSRGYFNNMFFWNDLSFVLQLYRERLLAVCVLSFDDSKVQLRYLGSPNAVVPP